MIILNFDLALAKSTTVTTLFFDNIGLQNGDNLLCLDDLKKLQKHPDYLRLRELGAFGIQEP